MHSSQVAPSPVWLGNCEKWMVGAALPGFQASSIEEIAGSDFLSPQVLQTPWICPLALPP